MYFVEKVSDFQLLGFCKKSLKLEIIDYEVLESKKINPKDYLGLILGRLYHNLMRSYRGYSREMRYIVGEQLNYFSRTVVSLDSTDFSIPQTQSFVTECLR